jgi:hypothetical protein
MEYTKKEYMNEDFINGMRYAFDASAWWLNQHCRIGFDCAKLTKFISREGMLEAFNDFANSKIAYQENEN